MIIKVCLPDLFSKLYSLFSILYIDITVRLLSGFLYFRNVFTGYPAETRDLFCDLTNPEQISDAFLQLSFGSIEQCCGQMQLMLSVFQITRILTVVVSMVVWDFASVSASISASLSHMICALVS